MVYFADEYRGCIIYVQQKCSYKSPNMMNSYFYHIPRSWNSIPIIDLSYSLPTIKFKLKNYFWNHFIKNFDSNNFCTFYYLCACSKCMKTPAPTNFFNSHPLYHHNRPSWKSKCVESIFQNCLYSG